MRKLLNMSFFIVWSNVKNTFMQFKHIYYIHLYYTFINNIIMEDNIDLFN